MPVPSVMKAGLMDLIFSGLSGVWGFSSTDTTVLPARVVMVTGAISGAKSPDLEACWALVMERMAYESWSSRLKE